MLSKKLALSGFGMMLALAACGGGGESGGRVDPGAVAQRLEAAALQKDLGALTATPVADLKRDNATYSGVAMVGNDHRMSVLQNNHSLSADIDLSVDFGTGAVTGGLSNVHENGALMTGDMALIGGQVAGNAIAGELGGDLNDVAYSAELIGQFVGADGQGLSGSLTDITKGGVSTGLTGGFLAER